MKLWSLFGTANQLLAALALLVAMLYLKSKGGRKYIATALPCLIMLVITNWAMVKNEIIFLTNEKYAGQKWLLSTIGAAIFLLALWMTIEALMAFGRRSTHPQRKAEVST